MLFQMKRKDCFSDEKKTSHQYSIVPKGAQDTLQKTNEHVLLISSTWRHCFLQNLFEKADLRNEVALLTACA